MVRAPVPIEILNLTWNDEIEEHFARHDVSHDDVMTVRDSNPLAFLNLEGRAGSHVMVGPDRRDRILYVSIRETAAPGIWEPITGWESRVARRLWQENRGSK